jgi:hypothetical protein
MQLASVPIAPINEDCDTGIAEHQIGPSRESWNGPSIDEVSEPGMVYEAADGHLRLRVSPRMASHPSRYPGRGRGWHGGHDESIPCWCDGVTYS